jgi:hypothetical protein
MKANKWLFLAFAMFGATSVQAASPTCDAALFETKISWPDAINPVWEMCFVAPNHSVGPRGSGLELRNVHYKGVLMIKRAHAPNLFAEYRNGAGGDCYRDWKDTLAGFAAEPQTRNQLGTPTPNSATGFFATTSCDVSKAATTAYGSCPFPPPGGAATGSTVISTSGAPYVLTSANCMASGGVAVENLPGANGLVLTTQYSAAWYQYTSRFFLYANGDIQPEFGFGNNNGTYNNTTHWHHNYWRIDFDIGDAANDQFLDNGVALTTETAVRRDDAGTPHVFTVKDKITGIGYRILAGANDNTYPANQSTRGFHTIDMVASRYKAGEYTDLATNNLSDCSYFYNNLANAENIDGQDVVLYYRASVRDSTANDWPTAATAIPQDSLICKKVGPTFQYFAPPVEGFADGFE